MASSLKIAVTGGTGFIGAHSVRRLLEAGHGVRVLVRSSAAFDRDRGALGALGVDRGDVEIVTGDVCDQSAVQDLLDGMDSVLHAAGVVAVDNRNEQHLWDVNVDATSYVLGQSVRLGLDPIVHVSSYSAMFPSTDPVIGPQSRPVLGSTAYARTKSVAERIARAFQTAGAPVVITYPSSVIGPPAGDRTGLTSQGWSPVLKSGWTVSLDGGVALIDVRDVADLHCAVMEPGRGPRRYMCGGEVVSFDETITILAEAAGVELRRVRATPSMVRAAGTAADVLARIAPVAPIFSREAAAILTSIQPTDDSATLAEFGMSWRDARQSLRESV